MNFISRILLFFAIISTLSCSTQGVSFTDHKDVWVQDSDKGLFYCRANTTNDGSADPTCFEAGFRIYEDSVKTNTKK
jgi:hypothetical protein